MTTPETLKEHLIAMQATQDTRDKFVDEEREQVKEDIKQLTANVTKIESSIVGVNTEVYHLKETVDEVKSNVKDGFKSLESKLDEHFKGNNGNNGNKGLKIKKVSIFAGIPALFTTILGGTVWQVGIRIGWWA